MILYKILCKNHEKKILNTLQRCFSKSVQTPTQIFDKELVQQAKSHAALKKKKKKKVTLNPNLMNTQINADDKKIYEKMKISLNPNEVWHACFLKQTKFKLYIFKKKLNLNYIS